MKTAKVTSKTKERVIRTLNRVRVIGSSEMHKTIGGNYVFGNGFGIYETVEIKKSKVTPNC